MGGFREAWDLGYELSDAVLGETLAAVVLWFLAAVFLVSGATKIFQPELAAQALTGFGIVGESRNELGRLLGIAELVLCVGLVVYPEFTILPVTVALWVFSFLIARVLRNGQQFPCACFGRSEDVISRKTLFRTTALAVVSTLVMIGNFISALPPATTHLLEAMCVLSALSLALLLSYARQLNQNYRKFLPEKG
jgi:hypothetical protein